VRNGSNWTQQGKLTAADAAAGDRFGYSVAISGNFVVVGAIGDSDGGTESGSAYVYVLNGSVWSQQGKLTADFVTAYDRFGYSVAISDDSVVVGSYGDDDAGGNSGSAYVFVRSGSNWLQQGKLVAVDAANDDHFGVSVAISGDSVVVSAPDDDDGGLSSGSVYVFVRSGSTWSQQNKLTAGDAAAGDIFGVSVSISGNLVVVGASNDNDAGENSGSAYVYERSGSNWSQQSKLTAGDATTEDYFGFSVSISGNLVVVGAPNDNDAGEDSGSAYVYERSGSNWLQQAKLTASDAAAGDFFGNSVAISGDSVVAGAPGDDEGGVDSGRGYIYRLTPPPTTELHVYNHLNVELFDGVGETSLPEQLLETGMNFTFKLTNAGDLDLDIQSISLGGADAGQFGLVLPDISSSSDLSNNESLEFTVSFNPTGSSGLRNAILIINSNDPDTPTFSHNITGLGFSDSVASDIEHPDSPSPAPDSTPMPASTSAFGKYAGFLGNSDGSTAGYFQSLKISKGGKISAKFYFGSTVYSLKGLFDENGQYSAVITPRSGSPATVNLQLVMTSAGGYKVEGTVVVGSQTANVVVVKSGSTGPQSGVYTLLLLNEEDETSAPQGHGYGLMTVTSTGAAKIKGLLGDGSKWTAKCLVTPDGEMPLYSALYGKAGSLGGLVRFRNVAGISDCDTELHWRKPGGFSLQRNLIGSRFRNTGARLIGGSQNVEARVGESETFDLVWNTANQISYAGPEKIKVKVSTKNGQIKGSVADSRGKFKMEGVIFQKQDLGAGLLYSKGGQPSSLLIVPKE